MLYQMKPLSGIHILSLAINLPGPLALSNLRQLGASAIKVEPPHGDPLSQACPDWYESLISGIEVIALDLKSRAGSSRLDKLLAKSDLLLTSSRPVSLARLGLSWPKLSEKFPQLLQVAIVGQPPPYENQPGHDLTYQAKSGLLDPPHMPKTLLADLAGADRAVAAALGLLLGRERGSLGIDNDDPARNDAEDRFALVSLSEAAEAFAKPIKFGLTSREGLLGGSLPSYNLYQAKEGWVAVATLEQSFLKDLAEALELFDVDQTSLAAVFAERPALEWEAWAMERNLPLAAVR